MIETLSIGKRRMYIHTPEWHTFYFIAFSFLTITKWRRGRSGRRRRSRRKWYSGWQYHCFWGRCTGLFATPACLQILCCAILAWKKAVHMMFLNHCQVSFYRNLQLFITRRLNSLLLLFLDLAQGFLIDCCVSSIVVCKNPPLAIVAIFKARRMSDCSSWSWPPLSATTLVSVRNTWVFRTALTALTEPRTLWRRITHYPSHCIHTPLLCGDVYALSERHVCYTLHRGWSYAEAVYTTPGEVKS